jgi:hypothetical protein
MSNLSQLGKKNDDNNYSLHWKSLEKVIEEKDIGVVIDSDLTFEKHINEKVNKANQMFATLRRTFQQITMVQAPSLAVFQMLHCAMQISHHLLPLAALCLIGNCRSRLLAVHLCHMVL